MLEDAVKDLDDFHNLLVTAKVPVESIKENKKRTPMKEGKKVKSTRDSAASREQYRASLEEQAEIDEIVEEMRDAHDAQDAKDEMEKMKRGEVSFPEAGEKTTETNNKEENNNEKDRKVEDL